MSGRRRNQPGARAETSTRIRCAIYTRKSSDEGLDQEFNSLDAQRESAEAFIASQKAEGWTCVPDRYDDGGFSGGSMERPALDRLLRDIEAGKVDCVVVYKVDRLSRSLMDFARIMEAFDRKGVSFVSVTQQFNTTSSMGRLTLNILLSFAQFEREIIGERIRDKIAAQKRKGKWAGGVPVLGYDVDRSGPSPRLVVNEAEAGRVRQIFQLYLDKGSLLPLVTELSKREWRNKSRVIQTGKRKGKSLGGKPSDKCSLYQLLTNPIYVGKIAHKGAIYDGEHEPIVEATLFDRVQALLKTNGRTGGAEVRNKYGALLRGLLRCKSCGHSMTHTFAGGRNSRSYRYYRCIKAIKSGSAVCPSSTLPAAEIERVVVDEIRTLATDKALLARVLTEAQGSLAAELEEATAERNTLKRQLERNHRALRELATSGTTAEGASARIAELHERIADAERRVPVLDGKIIELDAAAITRDEAEAAFADFDTLWQNLIPREQARLLRLIVSTVDYDATAGTVAVTFRPTSIRALLARRLEEAA
ncbi:MAG TPA: recombinase family protein [Phycisphaerales bacterium]|nr:recombinase family protein [Phycisphaerales bacterium]HMP38523.1 recombinase family protein [Phycisphaerales bacterium]